MFGAGSDCEIVAISCRRLRAAAMLCDKRRRSSTRIELNRPCRNRPVV